MKYRDEIRDEDIDPDLLNLEKRPDTESKVDGGPKSPDRKKNYLKFSKLNTILVGGVVVFVVAALFYFLMEHVKDNFISKDDTIVIQYQLSQINEKLEQDTIGKENAEKALLLQFNRLSERIDVLKATINSLQNEDTEIFFKDQIDQIALKMESIEDKIKALSDNVTTLTQDQRYHEVRRGENLAVIAQKYGLTIQELCDLNNIGLEQIIYPGQKLVVHSPPI